MTRRERKTFRALTGLSVAGFIALIAAQGKSFFEAVGAMPEVLTRMADAMPLGAGTFFLVTLVAAVAWYFAQRWLVKPTLAPTHGSEFAAELIALVTALVAMLALNLTGPLPADTSFAGSIIKAIMLGLLAGFAAPFCAKGVLGLFRVVREYTVGEDL